MTSKLWVRWSLAVATALFIGPLWAAVDVNKGGAADLDAVKGIGPAMSGRILEERRKGAFKDWPDLVRRVKGIGPATAARFSSGGLTVNGEPYTPAATPAAAGTQPPKGKKAAGSDDATFTRTEVSPRPRATPRAAAASH